MVFLASSGSKTVGWENAMSGLSGSHLPLDWLVPGSDCHFTYEHGDIRGPDARGGPRGSAGEGTGKGHRHC